MPEIVEIQVPTVPAVVEVGSGQPDIVEVTVGGSIPGPPGPQGPQGEPGAATTPVIVLTQTEYDALDPPDPESLYVIISP